MISKRDVGLGLLMGGFFLLITGMNHSTNAFAQEAAPLTATPESAASPVVEIPPVVSPTSVAVTLSVREKGTGKPLSKAEIRLGETKITTDPSGAGKVDIPIQGDGQIEVVRRGYETLVVTFDELRPGGEFDLFLFPKVPNDDVVIVVGQRKAQVSRKTITASEAARVAPGGDPAKVVKLLPGVQSRPFGNQVVIRGSAPNNSRYYIDDLEVPFIFHSIGDISILPPSLISEVVFDSGGFSVDYGDAMGGVITLRTKQEIPERPKTEVLVNIPFYSGIYHERPLNEQTGFVGSVRYSYVDLIVKKILEAQDEAGSSLTITPYFGDAHLFWWRKDDSGQTKVSLIGAYDGVKLAAPFDASQDEDGRVEFQLDTRFINVGVERQTRIDADWKYTSTPQFYYFWIRNNFAGSKVNLDVANFRVPTEFTKRLSKTEDWSVGIDPQYSLAIADIYSIRPNFDDPTFDPEEAEKEKTTLREPISTVAMWMEIDRQLGPVKVTPGVRGFWNSQLGTPFADPRIRFRWALNGDTGIKGAIGQFSESPDPANASKDYGNPELKFQRAYHFILGTETNWNDLWVTEVQGFFKRSVDLVVSDSIEKYKNAGSMKSYGLELFARRNLTGRAFGWASYTWSKTFDRRSDDDEFTSSQYDQTHVLNLVAAYKITAKWDLGTRYNYHTGDTFTPVREAYYNASLDKYQPRYSDASRYAQRLPDYHALSVYMSNDFLWDTWKLILKYGVEGYWFKPQPFSVSYNYDYSEEQYLTGLGAVPFLELKGEF